MMEKTIALTQRESYTHNRLTEFLWWLSTAEKELYNSLAHQNDKEAIAAFFELTKEDRTEKIKSFNNQWKEEKNQTFNGLWERMKKEVLTRQEH